MSDIPTQAQSRGAHSSDDSSDDAAYDTADFEVRDADAAHDAPFEPEDGYVDPPSGVDLDSDPFADDLTKELAHAAPKTWFNRTTMVIGGLVLIVGGFLGGIQVQKHYGTSGSSAATNIADLRNQFARSGGGARGEGNFPGLGSGAGAGATAAAAQTGTVKFVDGTTIYVTLADGTVLTVKTDGSTKKGSVPRRRTAAAT